MSSPTGENDPKQAVAPFRARRKWQILFLTLFGLLCGVSLFLDNAAMLWIGANSNKTLRNIGGFLSDYGDWPWLMLYGVPVLAWAWWKKRRRLFRLMLTALISCSISGLASNVIKATTGRSRPNHTKVVAGWYGLRYEDQWTVGKNKFASFPSGHTAAVFGLISVLALQRRRWSFLWFVPGVVMAWSRMVVNAHHLSDVCFGAWLGLLITWWCLHRLPRFSWYKNVSPP